MPGEKTDHVQVRKPNQCPDGFQGRYMVRAGDTKQSIAKEYGISLKSLINANPHIANPNSILTGDVLCEPEAVNIKETRVIITLNMDFQPFKANHKWKAVLFLGQNPTLKEDSTTQLTDWKHAEGHMVNFYLPEEFTCRTAHPHNVDVEIFARIEIRLDDKTPLMQMVSGPFTLTNKGLVLLPVSIMSKPSVVFH